MSFFSRFTQKDVLPPLDPEVMVNNKDAVLKTIDSLGLPREQLIVTGSSALTLLELDRRANDGDFIVHPDVLNTLHASPILPSGIRAVETQASRPDSRHFEASSRPLPSELFSHDTSTFPEDFDNFIKHQTRLIDGVRITDPYALLRRKESGIRIGKDSNDRLMKLAQDRYDAGILAAYLSTRRTR